MNLLTCILIAIPIGIIFMVIIYDITLTNFANNTVQNKSFGRYFYIHR